MNCSPFDSAGAGTDSAAEAATPSSVPARGGNRQPGGEAEPVPPSPRPAARSPEGVSAAPAEPLARSAAAAAERSSAAAAAARSSAAAGGHAAVRHGFCLRRESVPAGFATGRQSVS